VLFLRVDDRRVRNFGIFGCEEFKHHCGEFVFRCRLMQLQPNDGVLMIFASPPPDDFNGLHYLQRNFDPTIAMLRLREHNRIRARVGRFRHTCPRKRRTEDSTAKCFQKILPGLFLIHSALTLFINYVTGKKASSFAAHPDRFAGVNLQVSHRYFVHPIVVIDPQYSVSLAAKAHKRPKRQINYFTDSRTNNGEVFSEFVDDRKCVNRK
jgi:hypothetical protein